MQPGDLTFDQFMGSRHKAEARFTLSGTDRQHLVGRRRTV
jgi:hypothetical protein